MHIKSTQISEFAKVIHAWKGHEFYFLFLWNNTSESKYYTFFSFGLVTFQAAKEFVMSHEFNFPEPSMRKVKKEVCTFS